MKVKVTMHTGEEYEIFVENIDMFQVNEQRNQNELSAILIGNYSLSRINIRDVILMEEEEPPQEQPAEEAPEELPEEPTEHQPEENPDELENNS